MKKFVCSVCGYVFEGEAAPAACPQCKAPASKFTEAPSEGLAWADQHVVGVAKDVDPERRIKTKLYRRMYRSRYVSCNGKSCA